MNKNLNGEKNQYFQDGTFMLGVNYWASHAGVAMWKDWREDIVEADFQRLIGAGINVLRVFPLLSEFMPITILYGAQSSESEVSHGETFLDATTEEGRCGIDVACIEKFRILCRLAEKYGIKLIVPLITGWMSGRCFFPTAFNGKNMLTDPFCLQWEVRFVKYFVKTFQNEPTIIAWELGNECNCMAATKNAEEQWVWTNTIVSAVKSVDTTRPMLSGMHGLMSDGWRLEGQAELCDVLTVHPYILFTPYCDMDPMVSTRAVLHSPAELTMYADVGGRNCLVEEIGTLGGAMGDEEQAAMFVRANLWNAFIHNGLGMFWWCAFEQKGLTIAPYDWCEVERELGMFREDLSEKLMVSEYRKFAEFLKEFPYKKLPLRKRDAVCLIGDRDWKNGFGAFMLAKRAGLELKYASKKERLPDSPLYILPGGFSWDFMKMRALNPLLDKVRKGATLLITCGENMVSPFEDIIGCRSRGRKVASACRMTLDGREVFIQRTFALELVAENVEVLAYDQDGVPALIRRSLGKGNVVFLNAPLEAAFAATAGIADSEDCGSEKVYEMVKRIAGISLAVEKSNPLLNVTEHAVDESTSLFIVMNNTRKKVTDTLRLRGLNIERFLVGGSGENVLTEAELKVSVDAASAVVFVAKKI